MKDLIRRHKKAVAMYRNHIHKLYTMTFLEEDGLLNALEHTYDEIDHHLNVLRALKLAESHGLEPIKGRMVYKVRMKCDGRGCSKCEHKSCRG